ncbi:MAG: hypothetical protein N3D84_01340, partial [Candidatus Woesearchaeota archaeon]|nr:hypothetical protein [Candidatus Woesearchaeota archaeon]
IEAKLKVVAAIGLFNRLDKRDDGKSVEQYLKEEFNVPYYWLSDSSRILPIVAKSGKISKNILKKVEDEIRETGISPIKLV